MKTTFGERIFLLLGAAGVCALVVVGFLVFNREESIRQSQMPIRAAAKQQAFEASLPPGATVFYPRYPSLHKPIIKLADGCYVFIKNRFMSSSTMIQCPNKADAPYLWQQRY